MGLFSTSIRNLNDLFMHMLQDIYYAENQIVKALPDMIEQSSNPELRRAFQSHLAETTIQLSRLEKIFAMHGKEVKGVTCQAIDGIIKEARAVISDCDDAEVRDAALAACAPAVEHYGMTRYGTLIAFARQLGRPDSASVLSESLAEEWGADQKLTLIADTRINRLAA